MGHNHRLSNRHCGRNLLTRSHLTPEQGHSAAVWLSGGARTVHAFDFFREPHSRAALELLQRLYPGRLVAHAGDTAVEVPRAKLGRSCDLVVIDGGHSYANVVTDLVNLQAHATAEARFLFDDVCNVSGCESWNDGGAIHQGGPTLATCDLVRSGALRPLWTAFGGVRTFAAFARGDTPLRAPPSTGAEPRLPGCAPPCVLRWGARDSPVPSAGRIMQRTWDGHDSPFGDRARGSQRRLSGCAGRRAG